MVRQLLLLLTLRPHSRTMALFASSFDTGTLSCTMFPSRNNAAFVFSSSSFSFLRRFAFFL